MKAIHYIFLFLFLTGTQTLISQTPDKLRELGISLLGEYGFTDPAKLSTTAGLSPTRIFSRNSDNTWYAKDFNAKDKMDFSYSYGASLFFTASTPKFNLVTIEGGFKHSKLVYYYEFDTPLYSPQSDAVTHFQEWFYTNQYFANLTYSQHLGYARSLFFYAKVGGTYSQLSSRFIPTRNNNLYDGISTSGSTNIGNGSSSNLQINETVNETDQQFGILGGIGFEFRFGKNKRQSLFGGVFYRHNLNALINANYIKSQNLIVESNDDVVYRGNYYGYEFGYKFPIIPIRDKYNNSSNAAGKGTITVYLNPNDARSAGAYWRIDGGKWKKSGTSVSITEGTYSVEFSNVNGWKAPSSTYVNIVAGNSYSTTATYSRGSMPPPSSKKGNLKVALSPNKAIADGARWKISGQGWKSSNETIYGLPEGNYTIEFKSVSGWAVPSDRKVYVTAGKTKTIIGNYTGTNTNPQQSDNLEKDMQSCFNDKKSNPIYYENDLKVSGNKVEVELFPPMGEDNDIISVCVAGELELDNYKLSDEGKKLSIDISSQAEVLIIIKAVGTGSDGKTEIGAQVITGSVMGNGTKGQEVTLQLQKGDYYYIKVTR